MELLTSVVWAKLLVLSLLILEFSVTSSAEYENYYRNVYGEALQSCSVDGMALTGYTRTGYCVDKYDDQGSHHVCIDLSSACGGNFCQITGQDDWCSSEEMPCHEDVNAYCAIQQWCVCQWAFASYLENAGGCDQIQDIVCDAINLETLKGYWKQRGNAKYQNALTCIVERCGIEDSSLYIGQQTTWLKWVLWGAAGFLLGFAAISLCRRRRKSSEVAFREGFLEVADKP